MDVEKYTGGAVKKNTEILYNNEGRLRFPFNAQKNAVIGK